jgi:hypothetical protein
LVASIHSTLGGPPDLDRASSPAWNDLMQTQCIITAEEDALVAPWCDHAPAPNRLAIEHRVTPVGHAMPVALNPPGDPRP